MLNYSVAELRVNRINLFNRYLPQEKVYLHFDNTAYFMGEKMWFKAYVLRSDNHHATDVSRVLYVELLDRSGNVVETQKLPIGAMGQADGVFDLRNVLAGGFYEVRAYTRYMLNWDSSWLFSRVFPIFETPGKEGDYSRPSLGKTAWQVRESEKVPTKEETGISFAKPEDGNIAFFPEGGHLVENLSCRVAFEIRDRQGLPVNGTGELSCGEECLCSVSTSQNGRGVFSLVAQPGKIYSLNLKDKRGRLYRQELPVAEKEGCSMRVTQSGKSWCVNLNTTTSFAQDSLGIVLTAHGALKHVDVVAGSRSIYLSLPDSAIADGVNRVSVVNGAGQVLADRLFFQYPRTLKDSISVTVKETSLLPSSPINLSFHAPPSTIFSLSVRDADTEKNISSLDCENWLLLAGELHGYVSHPEYYFESDDAEHREAADLLMLVQGWRRYDLSQMMGKKNFKIVHPVEKGLSISGRLKGPQKKAIVSNQNLRFRLYNELGQSLSGNAVTDSLGYYVIEVPPCDGEWNMFVHIPKKYSIEIDRNFSPSPRSLSLLELMRPQDATAAMTSFHYSRNTDEVLEKPAGISMLSRTHMLPTVVKKKHFWESGIAWDNITEGKEVSYLYYNIDKERDRLLDKGEEIPYIYEWLKQKNHAFKGDYRELFDAFNPAFWYDKDVCDFSYNGNPILWMLDNSPRCITNGLPFTGTVPLMKSRTIDDMPVTMGEVKAIYITEAPNVWKRYLVGNAWAKIGNMATVFVYTHKMFRKCPKNLRHTFFDGYSPAVEFYSPGYGELPSNEDFRRTLYWNPYVRTNKEGYVDLRICNTGTCRQLIISAEAITPDGNIVKNR
ncbi:hypothetical protein KUA49_015080 [Segatella copri]|uniref:hypothetical protein n=1 Tax=Segatella copri TaxID=165179 RepID=UPI001C493291|nr:hypothetical protein [Segatella copri]WOZ84447.1 hypothetical protein KUA49_015080 [Segatella copri]